jgi:hypothetical protein
MITFATQPSSLNSAKPFQQQRGSWGASWESIRVWLVTAGDNGSNQNGWNNRPTFFWETAETSAIAVTFGQSPSGE